MSTTNHNKVSKVSFMGLCALFCSVFISWWWD